MAKMVGTTLAINEDVLRAVDIRAARSGPRDSDLIEESLRRDPGVNVLDEI